MRRFRFLIIFFLASYKACIAEEASLCPIILNYIQMHLPESGILRNSDGFVYVDLDDAYIHQLVTFIEQEGFQEPPYFGKDLVGAHITVIYPNEIEKYGIETIQETGRTIHFVPNTCQAVRPPTWQAIDEVYFVVVDAPELDAIREKYGLPKREYAFHITIGIKPY